MIVENVGPLMSLVIAIYIMAVGLMWPTRGPRAITTANRWIVRALGATLRAVIRGIGSVFVGIGRALQGAGRGRRNNNQHH